MPLNYVNLDERTRALMRDEIAVDIAARTLYTSPRLSTRGAHEWPDLLRHAAATGNDETLAEHLNSDGRLNQLEERRKPTGGVTMVKVPVTAAATLAEGEFNRFYIRALCQRAIEQSVPRLIVYRAKDATSPRRESEEKVGTEIDPQQLLADLRANPGVDTALGLPAGPNSGLSVRLPK
jgi:hypothetical protein